MKKVGIKLETTDQVAVHKTGRKAIDSVQRVDNDNMTAREAKDNEKTRDASVRVALLDAKKELKCGLCVDKFVDPRLLSCLHSFCFNCLRRYIDKGKHKVWFPCPLCSRKIDIPKGGVRVRYFFFFFFFF